VSALRAPDVAPHLALAAARLSEVTVEIATGAGGGAGIAWAPDLVVTNAHVVRAPAVRVRLADEHVVEARVLAADRRADLALLRVPRPQIAVATVGASGTVGVGALVVALGHPFGRRRTVTAGIVHAVGAVARDGRRWIQADLRLAPGNSSGRAHHRRQHDDHRWPGAGDSHRRRALLRHRGTGRARVSLAARVTVA
jgi:S1-C subfamily serine protease